MSRIVSAEFGEGVSFYRDSDSLLATDVTIKSNNASVRS